MGLFKKIVKSAIKNSINNSNRNNNLDLVTEAISKEINRFLILKQDKNYKFKSNEIEIELRKSLMSVMVDLRSDLYKLKSTYIHKTPNKMKEINNIISYYYKLDKSMTIEVKNQEISWEKD